MSSVKTSTDHAPLFSNRFVAIVVGAIALLALLSMTITILGQRYGYMLLREEETASTAPVTITIGQDVIKLPANVMRFENQRRDGESERVDLYMAWPEMRGFGTQIRHRFEDIRFSDGLIFLEISQSTMSRDMSGRLQPIYSRLFTGKPETFSAGLTLHRLRPESGYGNEVILTARRPGEADYIVRCLLPDHNSPPASSDCQRDIHVGRDLSVLYRFSSARLADWRNLDRTVRDYLEASLAKS
jgi:hypothetical protein